MKIELITEDGCIIVVDVETVPLVGENVTTGDGKVYCIDFREAEEPNQTRPTFQASEL